jgi:tight adherence protein B
MVAPVLVFAGVLAAVLLTYYVLLVRPEEVEHRRLRKRMRTTTAAERVASSGLLKEVERFSELAFLDEFLAHLGRVSHPVQRLLNGAGSKLTVASFLLATACCALIGFLSVSVGLGLPLFGIVAGGLTGMLPFWWLDWKRRARLQQFEEQFPEAMDLLARALRAGHAFTTAMQMVGEELPDPVGAEFRLMFDRQTFGMPVPDTLRAFAERVPIIDARFFATAVLTQRDAGGNLSEVLDNLSSVVRERFRVKRQIGVISAHGRITAWVLACMPPALAITLLVINPNHILMLVRDPLGVQMIVFGLTLQVVGTLIIRKLVNIEY